MRQTAGHREDGLLMGVRMDRRSRGMGDRENRASILTRDRYDIA